MGKDPVDWTGARTLADYVVHLFERGETSSKEFQVLLRIYGREKLEKLWREFQAKKKIRG